ncbi:MAG: hypothetical protein Kow0092_13580 [Deferrisomatales bacterium]
MRRIRSLWLTLALLAILPGNALALFGAAEKTQVGDDAPSFTVPLLDGGEFDLSPHLGTNAILLDFWSIYCVSCVQEMPRLVAIYEKYKDQGLVAVGVDLDSFGTKRVVKFVKGLQFQVTYPLVVDKRREVAGKYGVSVLPTTVVIDRQGKVSYYHVGYAPGDEETIEQKVLEALGAGGG